MPTDEPNLLISRREAARLLSVSLRKLDSLLALKEIPARRIGRRVLISRRSLDLFANAGIRREV